MLIAEEKLLINLPSFDNTRVFPLLPIFTGFHPISECLGINESIHLSYRKRERAFKKPKTQDLSSQVFRLCFQVRV